MKNNCEEWKTALLEAAAGGAVDGEMVEHLETCAGCGAEWKILRERAAQLEKLLPMVAQGAEASPDFRARVMAAAARKRSKSRPQLLILAGAAAAAVVLLMAIPWRQQTTEGLSQQELAAAQKLAEWRAPSDSLLATPGQEILRTTPKLGRSYLDKPPKGNLEE